MTRKILALALAGRKAEMTGAWARLGFVLDERGVALPDGVTIAFSAPGEAALIGLSGDPDRYLAEKPQALGDEEKCWFYLAPPHDGGAGLHPNGALGLKSVVFLASDPADYAEALTGIAGQREMLATSAGIEIGLEGGARLDVLSPAAFAFRFGGDAPETSGLSVAGLSFRTVALVATEKTLHAAGVETKIHAGRLLAGQNEELGVAVAFEAD
jgi:hypothetical protein